MSTQIDEKEQSKSEANMIITVRNTNVTRLKQQIDSLEEEYQMVEVSEPVAGLLYEGQTETLYLDWALACCHDQLAEFYAAPIVAGVV